MKKSPHPKRVPPLRAANRDELGGAPLRPLDVKRAKLYAKAMAAVRGGTEWLTAAEVAEYAGLGPVNPVATVRRWEKHGRIFNLRWGGKDYYPRYTLGADFHPLPVIKDILAVLGVYDSDLLAAWFDSTSRYLGGRRPRELVATAPADVLAAARNLIEVQENHG